MKGNPAHEKSVCRYRKWSIAEDIDLVVRCELDGVMKYKGQDQLLLIKALNEYDAKSSGRLQPTFPIKTAIHQISHSIVAICCHIKLSLMSRF